MLTKLQVLLIRWILEPLYRIKRHIPESVWRAVISLSTLGIVLFQFVNASGRSPRYLYVFTPFCLFLGLMILAGLSEGMKPISFSPVLLVCWGGVTLFMLISGIFVDSNVLADAALWLVAFPVFYIVWGNRRFSGFIKPLISGVYLSFAVFFLICLHSYPIDNATYSSFFLNVNGLAMYVTAVSVSAVVDILSQEKFSARIILADVILGLSVSISYYTASRAGQAALAISGCAAVVLFLIARREKLWKSILYYILPAVLALAILIPNTAIVINVVNEAVVKIESTWKKDDQPQVIKDPNSVPMEKEEAWDAIHRYNEERKKQGEGQGFDAFSTGRLELWEMYLNEVGILGNSSANELYNSAGQLEQRSAHNTLIQMAYEFGILAAVFFLAFNIVSGIKAVVYAFKNRAMDYSIFPMTVALAYGAYYMVEKIMYPAISLLLLLYLVSQVNLIQKRELPASEKK